jgi:prepilin-type N-terminal cleavage/methylation domain-containing protein
MKIGNWKLKINRACPPRKRERCGRGFSLIEVIFAAAIFAVVAVSIYQGFISVTSLVSASRDKMAAVDLINSEFELVRNLSYSNVGLQGGIPSGVLLTTSTVVKDGREFNIVRTIRNIDDPFDGTIGGSPNDLSPADYKMVQINVSCNLCKNPLNFSATTNVSPKNLETASTNGALFIKVFNANGNPVPQANVHVENSALGININETTDNDGLLALVDVPPAENAYRIIVSKSGFTTDRTYPDSVSNPNPLKPDATVILQQLTQISFVIDKVSTINVHSKNLQCSPVANVPFTIAGAKLIGTNPDVLKFSGSYSTDASGVKILNNMEWDAFTLTVGSGFNLAGVNPPSPFSVLPDSVQNVDIILAEGTPNNLLVAVKDSATRLPLSGVTLTLTQGSFSATKVTGVGYLEQTDWSGGGGQANFTDQTKYWNDDGNIDTGSPAGELKLRKVLGSYVSSGALTSSIFDTGTSSNFNNIISVPTDQPPQAGTDSVRFQFATSPDNTATTTWGYLGPDGTSGTYYTITNNNINPLHNGDRYFRYKVFLSTEASNKTPNIASIAVTYTSDCIPPGQAIFSGLSSGNHDLLLEKSGYKTQTYVVNIITNDDWQSIGASMSPQ